MYCKSCGVEIDDDSLFCSYCGEKQSIKNKPVFTIQEDKSIKPNNIEQSDYKLIPYRKGKKWGFCNSKKEIIIDCVYDQVKPFEFDRAIVSKSKFHWGIIDRSGNLLCDMKYESIKRFNEGFAEVYIYTLEPNRRKIMGFINLNGDEAIPLIYDEIKQFSEGLAMVQLGKKIGFINKRGDIVIDLKYEYDYSYNEGSYIFKEGLCLVCIDYQNYYFIDKEGKVIVDCNKYDNIKSYSEGLAAVAKKLSSENDFEKKIWGFIDNKGNEVIECKYKDVSSFSESLAMIRINDKFGFINKKDSIIILDSYDYATAFYEGFAQVLKGEYWGYIDKSGEIAIPFIKSLEYNCYNQINLEPFREGLFSLKENGKVGFRNSNNEIVIPHKYLLVKEFYNNLALVYLENKSQIENTTYIDRSGNEYYENFDDIPLKEIILRIKEYIKNTHFNSKVQLESVLIERNSLYDFISNIFISNTEIDVALLQMKGSNEIEFIKNNLIALTKNYKDE